MLKQFFSASAFVLALNSPAQANLGDLEETEKPLPPSFSILTFGEKTCSGYGVGFSLSDIILNSTNGTLYIPYEIVDQGEVSILSAQTKYIPCPA